MKGRYCGTFVEYREFEVFLRQRNKDINFGLKIKKFRTF